MKRFAYLAIIAAGCGSSSPGVPSGNLDERGGSLSLGAMTVDVPAGALTGSVAFTLSAVDPQGALADMSYRMAGDVTSFAAPVRVTFSVPTSFGQPLAELFAARYENGGWLALGDADHHAADHDSPHGDTHPAHHGESHDSHHDAPHDHVSGDAHGPGHFGMVHCPHGNCPHP